MAPGNADWAAAAAALPAAARTERERPFWRTLAAEWRWRHVADAGCGSGFHLRRLRELGAESVGFDAAIRLGNTRSLLPSWAAQGEALARPVRPGGVVPLLPTSAAAVGRLAAAHGLAPVPFPAAPPGGGAAWWAALSVPCS